MMNVFLNHKYEEKSCVLKIREYLSRCLINTWLDSDELIIGNKLSSKILDGINKCQFFVAFLSARYVQSDWCMKEFEEAYTQAVQGDCKILPILLSTKEQLELDRLPQERSSLINSVLTNYKYELYDPYDPIGCSKAVTDAINSDRGIIFDPIESKIIGGCALQIINLEVTDWDSSTLDRMALNIERDFVSTDGSSDKPLRVEKPVALSGKASNWHYTYLATQFKNLCPVFVYNTQSSGYVCVYTMNNSEFTLGQVLKP